MSRHSDPVSLDYMIDERVTINGISDSEGKY
jgi:hypothetical protein